MKKHSELHLEEIFLDDVVSRDHGYLAVPASRRAFLLIAVLTALIAAVAVGKVGFLNFFEGGFYRARAAANVSREVTLPSYRAVIVDRYGEVLAENESASSVFLHVPAFFRLSEGERDLLLNQLDEALAVPREELQAILGEVNLRENNWVPIVRNITNTEAIVIRALNSSAIQMVDDYERVYPDGRAFAHLIGYTGVGAGNSIEGKAGLELGYNEAIRGKDGLYLLFEDASGELIGERIIRPPKPSAPFETTIDAGLQRYLVSRMEAGLSALGRKTGFAIAMHPKTGEVLALASFPTFDSNVFVDRKRSGEREALLQDPSKPLFSRPVSGSYSPGSTIKPLVALAALREGVVYPATKIFSSGVFEVPNPYDPLRPSRFLDWKAHGWVNIFDAIARSSNIFFYLVGGGIPRALPPHEFVLGDFDRNGLGILRLNRYWRSFGFDRKTGIDLPFEGQGFLPNPEEKEERTGEPWRIGDSYNVAIGQGDLSVTPLQLLSFMASVGNGGRGYRPFLKKGMDPVVIGDYSLWQDEIVAVQRGLREAVSSEHGSSLLLRDLPIKVAGKTGTPQVAGGERLNALFAGYAPADDPEIAILVGIENAREGSPNVLPIVRDVFRWYYDHRMQRAK